MQQKQIKILLENNNFRNNQNYVLWNSVKREIISNFLMYKKDETYHKEKYPLFSMFLDWISYFFVEILNLIFNFFFKTLKINKLISLLVISFFYLWISFYVLLLFLLWWKWDNFFVWLLIFWSYIFRILYLFIKSKLDLNNYKIILFYPPYSKKFNFNFIDRKSLEWVIWVTKSFLIEIQKDKVSHSDNEYEHDDSLNEKKSSEFLIFISIFITIIISVIIWYNFYSYNLEKKENLIIHEKLITNLVKWKELLAFEKSNLYWKVLNCYKKNFPNIHIDWLWIQNIEWWYIKNPCLKFEKNLKKEIVLNRKDISRQYFENKLKMEESIHFSNLESYLDISSYKTNIEYHNNVLDF